MDQSPFLLEDLRYQVHVLLACWLGWQARDSSIWNQLSKVLKYNPLLYGETLYFLHRSRSPSSPQQVPGHFSNPTLLCVEAKAQFPASKGPLFELSFPTSISWAWTPSFWAFRCLGSKDFASRFVVLNSFHKPQCEGMSMAKKLFSWEGGEGVLF